jgi:cation:H+ antiporter
VYGLTLALRRSLTILDTVLLVLIFIAYLWRVRHADRTSADADAAADDGDDDDDDEASELFGPAAAVASLPALQRRWVTAGMLLAAAGIIIAVAEPFADSLVSTGRQLHVNDFLLVQWVAPLASETPEFIAVLLLAYRLHASAGLGALISSKINQWTILVGVLPVVFAASAGGWHGLPLDTVQREELLLTAAQSMFAVGLVITGRLTATGAWSLLGLFTAQFVLAWTLPASARGSERLLLAAVYLLLALGLLIARRKAVRNVLSAGLAGRPATGTADRAATMPDAPS